MEDLKILEFLSRPDGYGYGDGSGYGDGYGDGSGYGDGYGYGLKTVNGQKIYMIDSTPTAIDQVRGNVAKGKILMQDLSFQECFICKEDGFFAHGADLHEAQAALQAKLMESMPLEKRINVFCKEFQPGELHSNRKWFEWHHTLTGSCDMGRRAFAANHGIDLDGSMTPEDFFELTREAFAPEVMDQAEAAYKAYWKI